MLILPDVIATCIFSADFQKNPQISNFMKLCPVGAELFSADGQTDRQTDMAKLTVAFLNFANSPKNDNSCNTYSCLVTL
jgi:hypothetical protein